jgi:uncharacterized protein YcbX
MNVSEINIYPVKSLKGTGLSESLVEKRGLRFDRRWMLTDPDGMFFTQRQVPKMATITVRVESGELRVETDSAGVMSVPFEPDRGSYQNVIVWQSEVNGLVYNGQVSEWFSDALGRKCQLVLMPESSERHVNQHFDSGDDIVSFADGYPLLLANEASLEELNERIAANAELPPRPAATPPKQGGELFEPIPMNRFRPNVVVSEAEPFAEDTWKKIKIGETIFRVPKPCARCVIPTIDQDRGEFDGKEPSKTLATFRRTRQVYPDTFEAYGFQGNEVLFATNLIPENPGEVLRLGDTVEVLETI